MKGIIIGMVGSSLGCKKGRKGEGWMSEGGARRMNSPWVCDDQPNCVSNIKTVEHDSASFVFGARSLFRRGIEADWTD